jgi:hypothetical protein
MTTLRELKYQLLAKGTIGDEETGFIRAHLRDDGRIDLDEMRFLVELYCEADKVSASFKTFLLEALKEHILADGEIIISEQYYLLKALYADGKVDDEERRFLHELRQEVTKPSPEFDQLYEEVLAE